MVLVNGGELGVRGCEFSEEGEVSAGAFFEDGVSFGLEILFCFFDPAVID